MKAATAQQSESRCRVVAALEQLASLADERSDHATAERARALAGRLRADIFNLAVVGQFKRGKTTLINALLGRDILPAAVVPLTSVVTIIEHGPQERGSLRFLDGSSREIEASDLSDYVTERGNPSNRLGVAVAVVQLPSEILDRGLRIIDTPGVGSVHAHNTETAYAFIPHVDGAIFLVTADPPVSEAELQFLKDLRQEVQRVFFVQNKADQVPAADRQESLEFSRSQLAAAAGEDTIEMFSLSAREALKAKLAGDERRLRESGLTELEAALADFVRSEKVDVAITTGLRTAERLARQQMAAIAMERAALAMPLEELEQKSIQFEAYLKQMRQARDDNRHLLRAAGEHLVNEVINADLRSLQERVRPDLLRGLEKAADAAGDVSGRDLLGRLNAYMRTAIEQAYAEWIEQEERRVSEALREAVERFAGQVNQALCDLARVSQELFRAEIGELAVSAELRGGSEFYFAPWQMQVSPDTLSGSLLHVLPGRWVRDGLLKAVRAKLLEQLDMHGGRVRYDFVRRLEESLRDFERRILGAMDLTIAGIEEAIDRAVTQKRTAGVSISCRQQELAAQEAAVAAAAGGIGGPNGTLPPSPWRLGEQAIGEP
jgi:small GTP-binding protein